MFIKFVITPFAINILLLLLMIGLATRIQAERITVVTPEAIAFKVDNNVALAANSSLLTTTERLDNASYLISKDKDFIQDINSGVSLKQGITQMKEKILISFSTS